MILPFLGLWWIIRRLIFGWYISYLHIYRLLCHSKARYLTEFEYNHPFYSDWINKEKYKLNQEIAKAEKDYLERHPDELAALNEAAKWRKPIAIVLGILMNLLLISGVFAICIISVILLLACG